MVAAGMGVALVTNSGCDGTNDNIVNNSDCITCGKNKKAPVQEFDFCADVSFEVKYVPNSLPGVKDITFKRVPNDDCGYIGDGHGNTIGREDLWQAMSVESDGTNDSLVNIVRSDIVGSIMSNKVWFKDSLGNNASIIANIATSAKYIEVDLDAREIPTVDQWVMRDGKLVMPGIAGYVRNAKIEDKVRAYGEERSSRNSTYQLIKIVNPTLITL
jgi:hypothetical protein